MQLANLTIVILLLPVSVLMNNETAVPFSVAVSRVSSVARLVNAISLQSDVFPDATAFREVVAELLDVKSGDSVAGLVAMEVDTVSQSLDKIFADVQAVHELKITDIDPLKKGLMLLNEMRNDVGILETPIEDPTPGMQARLQKVPANILLAPLLFKTVLNYLKKIKDEAALKTRGMDEVAGFLKDDVSLSLQSLNEPIQSIEGYKDKWKDLLSLEGTAELLKNVVSFAKVSRGYIESKNAVNMIKTQTDALKTGISDLSPILESWRQTVPPVTKKLASVVVVTRDALQKASTSKKWTLGFPNGVDDVALLQKDLTHDQWLREALNEGKPLGALVSALAPFERFQKKMEFAYNTWTAVKNSSKTLTTSEGVGKMLMGISSNGTGNATLKEVQLSLGNVYECVKNLNDSQSKVDFEKFDEVIAHSDTLSKTIGDLSLALEKLNSGDGLNKTMSFFKSIREEATKLDKKDDGTAAIPMYDWIRGSSDLPVAIQFIEDVLNFLVQYNNPSDVVHKTVSWSEITNVLGSLEGTGLVEALKCLGTSNFEEDKIVEMLGVRNEVEKVKKRKDDVNATSVYLRNLFDMKKALVDVFGTVKNRTTRSAKGNLTLANSRDISSGLGLAVMSLRDVLKIHESGGTVKTLLASDPSIHQAVESVQGQTVWNSANRQLLEKMTTELKSLNESTMDAEDLAAVWKVFKAKIPGEPNIDASQFADPIAKSLASSRSTTAEQFRELSVLKLNFAQHQLNLKGAVLMVDPLKTFFDEFFGIKSNAPSASNIMSAETEIPWMLVGLAIGAIIFVGILVAVGLLIRRIVRRIQLYAKREHSWSYLHPDPKDNIYRAIIEGHIPVAMKLVKSGRMINQYDLRSFSTPLHAAVGKGDAALVKFLIKNGANRELQNNENETPLKKLLNDKKDRKTNGDKEDAKFDECAEVFKKLEGRKFRERVPPLKPLEEFSVRIDPRWGTPADKIEAFKAEHVAVFAENDAQNVTHHVVGVDKDGSFDIGAHRAPKLAGQPIDPYFGAKEDYWPTDGLHLLMSPSLLMSPAWIDESLGGRRHLYKDYENRVRAVSFNNTRYECVDNWKLWTSGRAVPALHGISVYYPFHEKERFHGIDRIVEMNGGTFGTNKDELLMMVLNRDTVIPYWYPGEKSVWVVVPDNEVKNYGKKDWRNLRSDAVIAPGQPIWPKWDDSYYEPMSFETFVTRLLEMGVKGPAKLERETQQARDKIDRKRYRQAPVTVPVYPDNCGQAAEIEPQKEESLEEQIDRDLSLPPRGGTRIFTNFGALEVKTPPHEAAPAPTKDAPAPAKAAPAPAKAAPAPVDGAPPPAKDAPAPVEAAPSPVDGAPAPAKDAPAPVEAAPAPVEAAPAPVEAAPAPVDGAPAPAKDAPAPAKAAPAPVDGAPAPAKAAPAPVDGAPAPAKAPPAPAKAAPAPVDGAPAPAKDAPAPAKAAPAPVDGAPAPAKAPPAPAKAAPAPAKTPAPVPKK